MAASSYPWGEGLLLPSIKTGHIFKADRGNTSYSKKTRALQHTYNVTNTGFTTIMQCQISRVILFLQYSLQFIGRSAMCKSNCPCPLVFHQKTITPPLLKKLKSAMTHFVMTLMDLKMRYHWSGHHVAVLWPVVISVLRFGVWVLRLWQSKWRLKLRLALQFTS